MESLTRQGTVTDAPRIAFLCYLNRSGSTLMARLLDESRDVAVSLESGVPDGIIYRGPRLARPEDIEPFLDRAYADEKFLEWGIDRDALRERLQRESPSYAAFLRATLDLALGDQRAAVHVYKVSRFWERLDRVQAWYPGARVIFVLRDLRGVYASQARSIDSRKGRPMSFSPGLTAWIYRRAVRVLLRNSAAPWLRVIRFENLVADPAAEVEGALRFLGASTIRKDGGSDYFSRIPDRQQHLHSNVGSATIGARTDAWRDSLSQSRIELLERIAGTEMRALGYAVPDRPSPSWRMRIRMLGSWILFWVVEANHWLRVRPWPWR